MENINLINDIRNDALILMKSRPDISYLEAWSLAKKNLIGDNKAIDFEFQPFKLDLDLDNNQSITDENNDRVTFSDDSEEYYLKCAKEELSDIMTVSDYNLDQLKAYVIAHRMGADVSKFANTKYNAEQINFLAVLLSSGNDISRYLDNYTFDPKKEILNFADVE